jgi:myosin heavy chain 9/10/11/14
LPSKPEIAQVRPLLAATRNDEELQKKELELALARERAERDKQERDALESLKMRLEAEKQKVEDKLTAERALALDKDSLLSRSKQRESELETYIAELEKEIADMKDDIDIMDSQLEQALKLRKENEEKHEHLKEAFGQAAEHLVRLESEQSEWNAREAELTEQYNEVQTEADALRASHFEQQKSIEELKNLIIQKEEDLQRAKDRMETAVAELDRKLVTESTNRCDTI